MRSRRWLLQVGVTLVLALTAWLSRGRLASAPDEPSTALPAPWDTATVEGSGIRHPEIGFQDARHLADHYAKHGGEFGGISRDEYLRRAQRLRDRPVGGSILEAVRDDGVITRFDQTDGDFLAADADGTIRTYFRPNDGAAYFQRQLKRGQQSQ